MIRLPPGCTVAYPIVITISKLTDEMVEWYQMSGGTVKVDESYDWRGRPIKRTYVQFGKSKPCHHMANGDQTVRLHFDGADASTASFFLLRFLDDVLSHNLQEIMDRIEKDRA